MQTIDFEGPIRITTNSAYYVTGVEIFIPDNKKYVSFDCEMLIDNVIITSFKCDFINENEDKITRLFDVVYTIYKNLNTSMKLKFKNLENINENNIGYKFIGSIKSLEKSRY